MKKKHSKSKKTFNWIKTLKISFLIIFAVCLYKCYIFTKPDNAPIKKIKIIATYKHISPQLVKQTTIPFLKNGFFYLNIFGLQNKILEIPWTHRVIIQRQWPNIITIVIEEQHPILRWGSSALLNSKGDVFYPAAESIPTELPVLFGPKNTINKVFTHYQKMQKTLKPLKFTIQELNLNSQGAWHLIVNNGMTIYLGRKNIFERLQQAIKLYPKIKNKRSKPIQSIDLRYNNGIAVK